ncbi:uncharacterized protein EDB93DRAFT_1251712 [Suillus bovinus]|uniref:uncharacterized protein n=1 Tax=Suillus bovinus TaxID=48563 RepID=UPI001B876D48|nr:uncharacterized protein EDB93DRAFT_1251712 [Suillus bovinus]KAG2144111.1 hypothetical protein EDB93DRAFT_1251712 [Suillus bovinus]
MSASPSARNTDSKVAKAQKGFFSTLFSWSPKRSAKPVTERPRATDAFPRTPSESAHAHGLSRVQSTPQASTLNLSRVQSAPQALTPNFPGRKVGAVPDVPRFKSIKDNLHELGLTTPVVFTQPQVAGSETVLSQLDRAAASRADMFFQRSLSHNMSPTSSKSRHQSSRGNALVATADHAINIDLPILNITSANVHFASSPSSATSYPSSDQDSQVDLLEKITVPMSTTPDKVPSSVPSGSNTSNREPPIPSSPSVASRSSVSQSRHSCTPSSTRSKRPRTAPGGSSELSRQTSVASARPQRQVAREPASFFPVDEGLFGRPKLPPPLKVIPKKVKKHQRTQTFAASPSPTAQTHEQSVTRTLSTRSHKTRQTSARLASAIEPAALFPIPNVLTTEKSGALSRKPSVLSHSRVPSLPPLPPNDELELLPLSLLRTPAPNEGSSSRANTQTTVASHETQFSTALAPELHPAKWTWTPPSSWSGPLFGYLI